PAGDLPHACERLPAPAPEEHAPVPFDQHLGAGGVADQAPPRSVLGADGWVGSRWVATLGRSATLVAEPHGWRPYRPHRGRCALEWADPVATYGSEPYSRIVTK